MRRCLFIRDDDVWTLDKEFRFFFDLAIECRLPIVYAIIPGKMERGLIRFLCRAKEKNPQLLDITQHGWVHANYALCEGEKYEFGRSRLLKFQREDIQQGFKKMYQEFGESFTPAFVPPYHGYDERTLRILYEEGFKVFSAGNRRLGIKKRFIEMPTQISFSRYEDGKTTINNASDVVSLLVRSMNQRLVSGVVTHHADFITTASRKELARFFNLVRALQTKKEWHILLFSDIERK